MKTSAIPGHDEAVANENFIRNASFLPLTEKVCGLAVLPFSVFHLIALEACGSPFVCGGHAPTPQEVAGFLWIVSPGYRPRSRVGRWRFVRRCRKLVYQSAVESIMAYIEESFQDSPAGKSRKRTISYFSSAAAIVDMLAGEYGWSEEMILRLPLKRAFQYMKAICKRLNPDAVLFNPSDRVIGRWLNSAQPKN